MIRMVSSVFAATLLTLSLGIGAAQAQTRVFVAAQGSDSNPCTFALPCRTFQHAHDAVTAGGEIDVLDPAGYGAVTINKSISIQGHGFAGIAVTSGNGITINAGPTDKISVRGLLIDGVGTGVIGIAFNTGGSLDIQECLLRNLTNSGVSFTPSANSTLLISDTHVASNGAGIVVSGTGTPSGTLDHVITENNGGDGFLFGGGTTATKFFISNSVSSNNGAHGVALGGFGNPATVMLWNIAVANNNGDGLLANGSTAVIRVTKSAITGNTTGLDTMNAGKIVSFGDNSLAGNTTDGAFTSAITLQ